MYPVISVLRRMATSVVYVRTEHLRVVDGMAHVALGKKAMWANPHTAVWEKASSLIPLFAIEAFAEESDRTAVLLAKKENELADKLEIPDLPYTLVLGPESEEIGDGGCKRFFRVGIVKGVFRHDQVSQTLQPVKGKGLKAQYSSLPPDVLTMRR